MNQLGARTGDLFSPFHKRGLTSQDLKKEPLAVILNLKKIDVSDLKDNFQKVQTLEQNAYTFSRYLSEIIEAYAAQLRLPATEAHSLNMANTQHRIINGSVRKTRDNCSACGCHVSVKTEGCKSCYQRHKARERNGFGAKANRYSIGANLGR